MDISLKLGVVTPLPRPSVMDNIGFSANKQEKSDRSFPKLQTLNKDSFFKLQKSEK